MEPKSDSTKSKLSIEQMLKKLDDMYNKEDAIKKQYVKLEMEWQQLQEDKELLQTMIMHQSNKKDLIKRYKGIFKK